MAILQSAGLSQTSLNNVTRGDPAWTRDYRNKNFRVDTMDAVFARISAIWPKNRPWPEDIPRHTPADVEPEIMAEVRDRLAKFAASGMESLPNG